MSQRRNRIVVLGVGWGFVLLGIAGLFLPILQGILFLVIGLMILSSEYVWAHHLLNRVLNHFPKVRHAADAAKHKVEKWMGRDAAG